MNNKIKSIENKITKKATSLNKEELFYVKSLLKDKKKGAMELIDEIYAIDSLLDYNKLIKCGYSKEELLNFINEDKEYLKEAKEKTVSYRSNSSKIYCFPTQNNIADTALIKYLRMLESTLPILNSCGDSYEDTSFLLSNKEYERKIIDLVAKNIQVIKPYWGYITTGGTEGNLWGIREGKLTYPNSKMYFSSSTHYGVKKIAKMLYSNENIVEVPTLPHSERIDATILLGLIKSDYQTKKIVPNLLLTFGTTCSGDIDDFSSICSELIKEKIPYYLHLDCAFYGGIPANSINAPLIKREQIQYVNSISISFHKYFGSPSINGILLARDKTIFERIEYIGDIDDSTISGSRSFPAFSLYKRVSDTINRSKPDLYDKKRNKFIEELNIRNIDYINYPNSNIFIINAPKKAILDKYQLSTFTYEGKKKIHIFVFPNSNIKEMSLLLDDIKTNN